MFGYFLARIWKSYCHIWNQHSRISQEQVFKSLTHAVNFGIGSAFSKDPGSSFSEGPGPGLGPLYKVCPKNLQAGGMNLKPKCKPF